jgi:hypothetical protein
MRDIFEHFSVRPNNQLLDPTAAVPNGHIDVEVTAADGLSANGGLEQRDAEGMVHYLLVQSKKPCLMVDSNWTLAGEPHKFPNEAAFTDAAKKKGCVVRILTCPDQGGTRHMMFIGKSAGLTEAEYRECVPASLPHLS